MPHTGLNQETGATDSPASIRMSRGIYPISPLIYGRNRLFCG